MALTQAQYAWINRLPDDPAEFTPAQIRQLRIWERRGVEHDERPLLDVLLSHGREIEDRDREDRTREARLAELDRRLDPDVQHSYGAGRRVGAERIARHRANRRRQEAGPEPALASTAERRERIREQARLEEDDRRRVRGHLDEHHQEHWKRDMDERDRLRRGATS